MHFEEHGLGDDRESGADRGIEAFEVADLSDAAEALPRADEFVGFGE
jgi:hypothetical protein